MKKKLKTLLVVAVAAVAGYNVYASHVKSEYSDVVLANVEALAMTEEEFIRKTCCRPVLTNDTCEGCDGEPHSFAVEVKNQ